jgi:hypothetical protein
MCPRDANLVRLRNYSQDIPQLAPAEPLSPELVLVLPAELRARAIAALGDPVWPEPRPRVAQVPALRVLTPRPPSLPLDETRLRPTQPSRWPEEESWWRALGAVVGVRLVQLALIFTAVLLVTLAMSLVAQAFR